MAKYPSEAFAPSGKFWWEITHWPSKPKSKFGTEPKIAAWFKFNVAPRHVFTLRQLRKVIGGSSGPNDHEHFNRRLRELRKYGWIVHSARDAGDLEPDEYRLVKVGKPIWKGKSKFVSKAASEKTRREVFDRDGHRCVLCGVGAGEPYPDEPAKIARLTLGHLVAHSLEGENNLSNLRTECSRCNEPAREEAVRSETAKEIWPKVRSLSRNDKLKLLSWIQLGRRERDLVDRLYDQIRPLPAKQREELQYKIKQAVTPKHHE